MKTMEIPFIEEIVALRRDLHAHPEVAFEETRTSETVACELESLGLEVYRGLAKTGVVGVLRGRGRGRSIGLRADMDALILEEKNDLPYRSQNPGRQHGCGHDGHVAILLGAAKFLTLYRDELDFDGTIHFIFQPAEEGEGGAKAMIDDGLFERFPMESVFGMHNWPELPEGRIAVVSGPVMASDCHLKITVRGRGCHAAMPQQGVDTLVAASHLVLALQTVVSRNLPPWESAVVSVTRMHGGSAMNIIPDEAVLYGTIRSFSLKTQDAIETAVKRLCDGIGEAFGATADVEFERRYPPTVNSDAEAKLCARAAGSVVGLENVVTDARPSTGAEDFAYMLLKKPGAYVWLGSGDAKHAYPLHSPNYDFNDGVIATGIRYWVSLVETVLGKAR
ncbi:MAG: amidohydrolase [Candidatus Accumulibacter sp.]|nr:amidohydrolase [Accumulibacter sp.]